MNSLVTGGCGFIGSHMVDRLQEEGHTVSVIAHTARFTRGPDSAFIDKTKMENHNIVTIGE